jgi:multimeric flavodoxin WrbA
MKVLGICGSPKGSRSTTLASLKKSLAEVEKGGVETEIIDLSEYKFYGCEDCGGCSKKLTCSQNDDFRNIILPKLSDSNVKGVIFASPVYFGGVTSQLKTFMDRSVPLRRNGFLWENVVSGALAVGRSRNGGQELAVFDIIKNSLIHGMIVVSDSSPTAHFGATLWSGHPDGVENDEAGIKTAENLGKKVVEIVKKLDVN